MPNGEVHYKGTWEEYREAVLRELRSVQGRIDTLTDNMQTACTDLEVIKSRDLASKVGEMDRKITKVCVKQNEMIRTQQNDVTLEAADRRRGGAIIAALIAAGVSMIGTIIMLVHMWSQNGAPKP